MYSIPGEWQERLAGYDWQRAGTGQSAAEAFHLTAKDRPSLFVKSERQSPFAQLAKEAACLRWLATTGVMCPAVLAETHRQESGWLLMSALPGADLASDSSLDPEQIVDIVAGSLRQLHALDTRHCPFDQTLTQRIAEARARLEAGLVDESDMDRERLGRTAKDVFDELLSRVPASEDLAVTHGDACLDNLLSHQGRFAGFVDCGRLGVADYHMDLALACRNIRHALGEKWSDALMLRYGKPVDPERIAFYQMLDEFF